MSQQYAQFNRSNMSDPMFVNVLNVRVQLANQISQATNIQYQYTLDSNLTTERNHMLSLQSFNKWTDSTTNLYIICRISADQFIFQPTACPAGIIYHLLKAMLFSSPMYSLLLPFLLKPVCF